MLDESDALRPWYPASTSKLMTIYVVFRAIKAGEIKLDTEIVYSRNAANQPPSKMAFRPGTTLTLDDALKMMMVKSANDIAVVVAEAVGGSVSGFSERMNLEAARLGMRRSHFVNPHGLPDERQVSSARDMAVLARALLRDFPEHRPFYNLPAIEFGGKTLRNYNTLVRRYPGTTGMKTGFICASGYNLVASAQRGEREVIAVVFGEYGGAARAEHAASLLEAGFKADPAAGGETPGDRHLGRGIYASRLTCAPMSAATSARRPPPKPTRRAGEAEAVSYPGAADLFRPPGQGDGQGPGRIRRARFCRPRAASPARQRYGRTADGCRASLRSTSRARTAAPAAAIGDAAGSAIPLKESARNRIARFSRPSRSRS